MKSLRFVLLASVIVVFAFVSASYAQYTIVNLTKDNYDQGEPQINDNGYVVWKHCKAGPLLWCTDNLEIFLYDGTTTIQLTDNDYRDSSPRINNNGYVVWLGYPAGIGDIFLHDGMSITQITSNADIEFIPQINDSGYVVWTKCDGSNCPYDGDNEIFLYDGTTTIQLTDNDYNDGGPQINNNGCVVWPGWRPGEGGRSSFTMARQRPKLQTTVTMMTGIQR